MGGRYSGDRKWLRHEQDGEIRHKREEVYFDFDEFWNRDRWDRRAWINLRDSYELLFYIKLEMWNWGGAN